MNTSFPPASPQTPSARFQRQEVHHGAVTTRPRTHFLPTRRAQSSAWQRSVGAATHIKRTRATLVCTPQKAPVHGGSRLLPMFGVGQCSGAIWNVLSCWFRLLARLSCCLPCIYVPWHAWTRPPPFFTGLCCTPFNAPATMAVGFQCTEALLYGPMLIAQRLLISPCNNQIFAALLRATPGDKLSSCWGYAVGDRPHAHMVSDGSGPWWTPSVTAVPQPPQE